MELWQHIESLYTFHHPIERSCYLVDSLSNVMEPRPVFPSTSPPTPLFFFSLSHTHVSCSFLLPLIKLIIPAGSITTTSHKASVPDADITDNINFYTSAEPDAPFVHTVRFMFYDEIEMHFMEAVSSRGWHPWLVIVWLKVQHVRIKPHPIYNDVKS